MEKLVIHPVSFQQENSQKPDVPSGLNEFHFGGSNALKVERVVMHPVSFHVGCPEIRPAFVEMRQLVLYIGLAMVISLCVVLCGLAYLTVCVSSVRIIFWVVCNCYWEKCFFCCFRMTGTTTLTLTAITLTITMAPSSTTTAAEIKTYCNPSNQLVVIINHFSLENRWHFLIS